MITIKSDTAPMTRSRNPGIGKTLFTIGSIATESTDYVASFPILMYVTREVRRAHRKDELLILEPLTNEDGVE